MRGARSRTLRDLPPHHPFKRSRRSRLLELACWRLFDSRAHAQLRRRAHVLCLGDSHLRALAGVTLAGAWLRPFAVGGATASGIRNRNSQTRARALFDSRLEIAPRWQHVLVALGEVDCGFAIWQRAAARDLNVEKQLELTLDGYSTFLAEVVRMGFESVSALGATLPTLDSYDEIDETDVARRRRTVTTPIEERTKLTLDYNAGLAKRCQALGIRCIDTTKWQLDPATGLIRRTLTSPGDYHLSCSGYAEILTRALEGTP